jgi:hypothetical protein
LVRGAMASLLTPSFESAQKFLAVLILSLGDLMLQQIDCGAARSDQSSNQFPANEYLPYVRRVTLSQITGKVMLEVNYRASFP